MLPGFLKFILYGMCVLCTFPIISPTEMFFYYTDELLSVFVLSSVSTVQGKGVVER